MDLMKNPWGWIHIRPRKVMKQAFIHSERKQEWMLIILFGMMLGLEQASLRSVGDSLSFPLILIMALLLSPLIGAVAWYVLGGIAYWVGNWFGGTATWEEIRTSVAWSSIPFSMKLILWIPFLAFFGDEMFTSLMPSLENSPLLFFLYFLLMAVDLVITIWYGIILCKGVGEAHDFSAWKSLLSFLIGYLIILLPLMVVAVFFRM